MRLVALLEVEDGRDLLVGLLLRSPTDESLSGEIVGLLLADLEPETVVVTTGNDEPGADVE